MGIISDSNSDKNTNNGEKIKEETEKFPQDNIKKGNNKKKDINNKININKKQKTKINNLKKKLVMDKEIKIKNRSEYTTKTFSKFSNKTPNRGNLKTKKNREIKELIILKNKRNTYSIDKINKKLNDKQLNKKTKQKNNNINYKKLSLDLGEEDDDFDIIYNEDDLEQNLDMINQKINKDLNQEKVLKEKINNAKKKIINIRKKLNSEINKSSKEMNVNNKIKKSITFDNNNIKQNKISNTIFINNSNITISNTERNYLKKNTLKKRNNNPVLSEYINNYNFEDYNINTFINQNLDSIEIDSIYKSDIPSKITIKDFQKKINKTRIKKYLYPIKSLLTLQPKENLQDNNNKLSLSLHEHGINKGTDSNIIDKMEELKEKIKYNTNYRYTPSLGSRTTSIYNRTKFQKSKIRKKSETLDIKHIKHNIPNYRRCHSKSNNYFSDNSDKIESIFDKKYSINLKDNYLNRKYNYTFRRRKKNSKNYNVSQEIKESLNKDSSVIIKDNSTKNTNISTMSDKKNIKNKNLLNVILQNIIKVEPNNNINNNTDDNNIDKILLVKYRDAINIDISSINIKESLVDKDLIESNINNKILINYSILDNISNSKILFDGIIYKVADNFTNNVDKKYKIMERYFQLKKNCFKYFNNIQLARYNPDKPLVQFDIRHIKDMKIIDSNIFEEYKLNGNKIKFTFAIFLNQNSDFFTFLLDNEDFGNSLFNLMNLLKNYYDDKKV